MKKYLVIGNPIEHSLSPKLHNYWMKKKNIKANYEKKKINENEISNLILRVKKQEIDGINVTVPFKKAVIPFLDDLSTEAQSTQSVNTICLNNGKVIGYNTDIGGFEDSIKQANYNIENKKIFILGSGGVVPSIIFALYKMKASEIIVSNRTKEKAENLKILFKNLKIANWGECPDFDVIINATSVGLDIKDEIELDLSSVGKNKLFYDVIYNPRETNFLKTGKKLGNKIENGKMMFIYQARLAFKIWHGIDLEIDKETLGLLEK